MTGNAGVILAGGKSSRMGTNKAAMLFAGEPLLQRVVRRLAPLVDDVLDELLVVGPVIPDISLTSARHVSDLIPDAGPLGGLYTAFLATSSTRLVLVACDMPLVQTGLLRAMLMLAETHRDVDAVVLTNGQQVHPLHAVYDRRCLPAVTQALTTGDYAMQSLLAHLTIVPVPGEMLERQDPHGVSALNVNTPEDWQRAVRLAAKLEPGEMSTDS